MILIFSNTKSSVLEEFTEKFKKRTDIKIALLVFEEFIKNGNFWADFRGKEKNTFCIDLDGTNNNVISLNDVKICYFSGSPYILPKWFEFEDKKDCEYAGKEWYSSVNSLFLTQPHLKLINPVTKYSNFNSEYEQSLFFKKFEIECCEMLVTNNKYDVLEYYDLWNKNVLYKSVNMGYDSSSILQVPDLGRLDKLKYCPALFQKLQAGIQLSICIIGNDFLSLEVDENQNTSVTDIPNILKEKLIKLSKHFNSPLIQFNFLYDSIDNEYYAYSFNIYNYFESLYTLFGDPFQNKLIEYLEKEYKNCFS